VVFHQSGFTTFLSASRYTFGEPDKTGCDTVVRAGVSSDVVYKNEVRLELDDLAGRARLKL
jgi:hypothetical protein